MKLLKIEEYENQIDYWDIEVEDNNNFYANGILVHNSNAGVTLSQNGELTAQSRERELTLTSDNAGFCLWMNQESHKNFFLEKLKSLIEPDDISITVFGEWAGGNIQKGVAVCNLPKQLYVFSVCHLKQDGTRVYSNNLITLFDDKKLGVYNLLQFEHECINIDFEKTDSYINKFVEEAEKIGDVCPVGKKFGITNEILESTFTMDKNQLFHCSGDTISDFMTNKLLDLSNNSNKINLGEKYNLLINKVNPKPGVMNIVIKDLNDVIIHEENISSIGEGIVLCSVDGEYIVKFKNDKHSVSKIKTTSKVDEVLIKDINDFVENVVTENRLLQGIEKLKEMNLTVDEKSTGEFIKWVQNDVFKEEIDIIVEKKLLPNKVKGVIANKARKFFMNYINTNI